MLQLRTKNSTLLGWKRYRTGRNIKNTVKIGILKCENQNRTKLIIFQKEINLGLLLGRDLISKRNPYDLISSTRLDFKAAAPAGTFSATTDFFSSAVFFSALGAIDGVGWQKSSRIWIERLRVGLKRWGDCVFIQWERLDWRGSLSGMWFWPWIGFGRVEKLMVAMYLVYIPK